MRRWFFTSSVAHSPWERLIRKVWEKYIHFKQKTNSLLITLYHDVSFEERNDGRRFRARRARLPTTQCRCCSMYNNSALHLSAPPTAPTAYPAIYCALKFLIFSLSPASLSAWPAEWLRLLTMVVVFGSRISSCRQQISLASCSLVDSSLQRRSSGDKSVKILTLLRDFISLLAT